MYKITAAVLVVLGIVSGLALTVHGGNIEVLNPKGPVARQESQLIFFTLLLAIIIVVPVFTMLFAFAWKYRAGNKAKYTPDWDSNRLAETVWWLVPTAIILVVSVVIWNSSHTLDPYRPLASSAQPVAIQVVALDWKWLFIYPKEGIATVNFVEFPKDTPINFAITSDAPMNSFWIPQLSGQIYAMPGMSTQLHMLADTIGSYNGSSGNISGRGFAGMTFVAKATSAADFKQWVSMVKRSPDGLSIEAYKKLAEPSKNNSVAMYSSSAPGLYDKIIMKYMMPGMGMQ